MTRFRNLRPLGFLAALSAWIAGSVAVFFLVPSNFLLLSLGLALLLAFVTCVSTCLTWQLAHARHAATLDEHARRNRLIVESACDAILTFDYEGRIESFNAAAVRLFGYEVDEVLGQDLSRLLETSEHLNVDSLLLRAIQTGGARVLAPGPLFQARHKSGRLIPIELGLSKVLDENRRIYIQIVRDLSERQLADRQRQLHYEVARQLAGDDPLETLTPRVLATVGELLGWHAGLYWLLDRDAQLLRAVASWARDDHARSFVESARQACHVPGSGLPGRVWLQRSLVHVANLAQDPELAQSAPGSRTGLRSALAWPVELAEEFLGVLEFYSDELPTPDEKLTRCLVPIATQLAQYTRRCHHQQELHRAKDAAESANRAKSEFLANISHEMRTPLTGILGLTDLMLSDPQEPKQREHVALVQSSAGTLLELINDLLDLAKIEAARMTLHPVPFPLRESLEPTLRLLGVRAAQKQLAFHYDFAPDLPPRVVGDSLRIQQVLLNLVGNALKFTHAGGEVHVRLAVAERSPQAIVLHGSVRDTGIGIPHDRQEDIFEAFCQVDAHRARKYGGTGLGLTITNKLVALMQGHLRVESTPGVGTTFHFHVQLGLPETTPPPELRTLPPVGKNVLVAVDNPVNRVLLELILQERQHRVTFAPTAAEALAACRRVAFDLILFDAASPELTGLEDTIRQHLGGGPVPPLRALPTPVQPEELLRHVDDVFHARG